MADAEIEDALYQRVLATRSIKRRPLRKVDNLARSRRDVGDENCVAGCLGPLLSGPVDGLVEQVSVRACPVAQRVAVGVKCGAFDMFVVLCFFEVSK